MSVNTTLSGLSQIAANNGPDGTVDPPSFIDDAQRYLGSFIASLRDAKGFSAPVTLASAGTTDIGAQNAFCVEISGTTTITSLGTSYNGPRFLRFSGVLTLTHNATTLNLPGAANITTAAGDTCIAVPNLAGNGWNILAFQSSAGYVAPGANSNITSLAGLTTPLTQGQGGTGTATPTTQLAQIQSTQTGSVATGTTILPVDNTTPQITEGDQYMTVSITPKNASSKLVIDACAIASTSATTAYVSAALFQDAVANALKSTTAASRAAGDPYPLSIHHEMTAGTTSAITFRIRVGSSGAATTTFNGSVGSGLFNGTFASFITVKEYLPIP